MKITFGKRKPEAGAWLPKRGKGAELLRLLNATWKLESFGSESKEPRCLPVDNGRLGGWEALKWRPFGKSPLLNGRWLGAGRTMPSPCHSLSPRLPSVNLPKWLGRRVNPQEHFKTWPGFRRPPVYLLSLISSLTILASSFLLKITPSCKYYRRLHCISQPKLTKASSWLKASSSKRKSQGLDLRQVSFPA